MAHGEGAPLSDPAQTWYCNAFIDISFQWQLKWPGFFSCASQICSWVYSCLKNVFSFGIVGVDLRWVMMRQKCFSQ
ncbi:MAG: hypothetical protein CL831_10785 [Crocinitomicaceae bacterium]|nr:hypothetical protein [Crocinitomicaceae bacterium]